MIIIMYGTFNFPKGVAIYTYENREIIFVQNKSNRKCIKCTEYKLNELCTFIQ